VYKAVLRALGSFCEERTVFEEMEDFQGGDECPDTARAESRSTARALYAAADVVELLGMAYRALCRTRIELDADLVVQADRLAHKLEYLRGEVDMLRYRAARSSAAWLGADDAAQLPKNAARPTLLSDI
jgi:hypothetical protein